MDERRCTFAAGQLVIVDEASQADTRTLATLATLTTQAARAGAKVLLVGDHLQRGSVDAGGVFAMLARPGPTAELTAVAVREPWEGRASLELRHGQRSVLDAYERHASERHGAFTAGTHDDVLDTALEAATTAPRPRAHGGALGPPTTAPCAS